MNKTTRSFGIMILMSVLAIILMSSFIGLMWIQNIQLRSHLNRSFRVLESRSELNVEVKRELLVLEDEFYSSELDFETWIDAVTLYDFYDETTQTLQAERIGVLHQLNFIIDVKEQPWRVVAWNIQAIVDQDYSQTGDPVYKGE
jgi:hypothetical protein